MTRNKKIIMFALATALIIIIASYSLFVNQTDEPAHEFYYGVDILIQGEPTNYSLIVPMPDFQTEKDYWTNFLLSESIVEGDLTITIMNTSYGKGLMLNASDNCRLYLQLNESVPAENLTMNPIGSHYAFYAFISNQTTSISIDVNMDNYEFINSTDKIGVSNRIHVYPVMSGWYEQYGGIIDTYP